MDGARAVVEADCLLVPDILWSGDWIKAVEVPVGLDWATDDCGNMHMWQLTLREFWDCRIDTQGRRGIEFADAVQMAGRDRQCIRRERWLTASPTFSPVAETFE